MEWSWDLFWEVESKLVPVLESRKKWHWFYYVSECEQWQQRLRLSINPINPIRRVLGRLDGFSSLVRAKISGELRVSSQNRVQPNPPIKNVRKFKVWYNTNIKRWNVDCVVHATLDFIVPTRNKREFLWKYNKKHSKIK